MKVGISSPDEVIADLAAAQHGLVARRQLLDLGVGEKAIWHRVRRGRLHTLHRGVYAVGHTSLSREGRWLAAVLAAGPGGCLSHRSAGALWAIGSERGRIDVTAPTQRRPLAGVHIHTSPLPPDEVTVHHAIPTTTPFRTLFDLAAVLDRHALERALANAEHHRLADPLPLEALLARHPRRRGTRTLRALLDARDYTRGRTRSPLEDEFLRFLDRHALPRPELNPTLVIAGNRFDPDCLWRDACLIAELDGRTTHLTPTAFEADRRRDRTLQAHGWTVVRITTRHLRDEPTALLADLRALLARPTRNAPRSPATPAATTPWPI